MNIPNFPTTDNEYEYTNEDFIKDTQPCWVAFELEQKREMQKITDKYIDEFYANPDNQPEPIVYDDEDDDDWEYTTDKPLWMDGVQMQDIDFGTPNADHWDDEENSPTYYS